MITKEIKKRVLAAIKESPLSMLEASKIADMPYRTFIFRAQKLGVYKPNQHHTGRTFPNGGKNSYPLEEILKGMHPAYKTRALKHRMLNEGMFENKCDKCGLGTEWEGEKIVLELDHINGVSSDHRRKNLRLLCPNCHSQTPTFRGRKKK